LLRPAQLVENPTGNKDGGQFHTATEEVGELCGRMAAHQGNSRHQRCGRAQLQKFQQHLFAVAILFLNSPQQRSTVIRW
jgi:hypothetical protein